MMSKILIFTNTIILTFVFFNTSHSFSIDLKHGNKYFIKITTLGLGYPTTISFRESAITDTLTRNNKKYYFMNNYFGNYRNLWIRQDSITKNIYYLDTIYFCTTTPGEKLLDSLNANLNNLVFSCNSVIKTCISRNYINKFGDSVISSGFNFNHSMPPFYFWKGWNHLSKFGFYKYYSSSSGGGSYGETTEELIGCKIDGIMYGDSVLTDIFSISESILNFNLNQNYPNPFNPETNISFSIKDRSKIKLSIFDNIGREVSILVNSVLSQGNYNYSFSGENLPSGIYYYKLESEKFSEIKKMVLIK